jgi:hypothetical protein
MTNNPVPPRGAVGGAANEAGTEYRRGVAAYFVAHGLNGVSVHGLPVEGEGAKVDAVRLEADSAVDDVVVSLRQGTLFIQAKRKVDWGLIPEIVSQWITAVRQAAFDSNRDFLVAVAGSISGPVRSAAQALRRARMGATSYSTGETQAIKRLRVELTNGGASPPEIDVILARAVILLLAVEESSEIEATQGRLLLDGHVVAKDEGARAWRELLSIAGDAARLRVGHSVETWLAHLRERGLPLTADATASRAGYLTAKQNAVTKYREILIRRGAEVDVNGLGIAVPAIAFEEMDADIQFHLPGNDENRVDPFWAFRRYGRLVAAGLPGSGKSTIVANIAGAWAAHANWSIPILVPLRRLAEKGRFRERPLRDQIVEMAVALVDPMSRALLTEALHEALQSGQAVLFFDGLDEAADRSLLLVSDISKLLDDVHPDTDVLVATRDINYADTRQLGFVDLRVGPPQDISRLLRAVFGAIATVQKVEDRAEWIVTREEWVTNALDADTALRETPLFPVLLAALAANLTADTLPQSRTAILEQVVQDIVRRNETTRNFSVPYIDQSHHGSLLVGAFQVIASSLMHEGGSAARSLLADRVASYLKHDWGLPAGVAVGCADKVLLFWDEAGVFVASGATKTVTPRVQLMMEVGTALHAAKFAEVDAVEWIRQHVHRPVARETLVLAAGKSRIIADALIAFACDLDDDALVIAAARAIGHGGTHKRLLAQLRAHVARGGDEGWRAFRQISALSVPVEHQEPILQTVDAHFPQPYPSIARAFGCLRWNWQPERLNQYLETVLLQERPELSSVTGGRVIDSFVTDNIEMLVLETAATTLIPTRPDLAPAAAMTSLVRLRARPIAFAAALLEGGHQDLVARTKAQWMSPHRQPFSGVQETRKQIDRLLALLRSFAQPATLELAQQRRLAEVASFVETLNINSFDGWPCTPTSNDRWPQFVKAVLTLGGFDAEVLAAQAAIVEQERDFDPYGSYAAFWSLIDLQPAAPLVRWDRLVDVSATTDLLTEVLHSGGDAARRVAANALSNHPDKVRTAAKVRAIIDSGPAAAALPAVLAYLHLVGDFGAAVRELERSQRASVREAVAWLVTPVQDGRVTTLTHRFMGDPVRQVRLAVLHHFQRSDDYLRVARNLLNEVAASPDPGFTCSSCGRSNEFSADSCASCHVVTERPSRVAERLIKKLETIDGVADGGGPAASAGVNAFPHTGSDSPNN